MNKFSYNASRYTNFRPQYPNELFHYIKTTTASSDFILECGAGSGQATEGLSQHCKHIIATDISLELLSKAKQLSNVLYLQSSAEQLPIRSKSLNLVCVAQAIHWFCLNDFYDEVKRVLKRDGVIAAWCYNQAVIEPDIDAEINEIYLKISSLQNFSRERQYLYEHYETIPFPFTRIPTPKFALKANWNLMQYLGYISTWPGLLEYNKKLNIDLLFESKDKLISAWGDPQQTKMINWPIYLLLGRVN